MLFFLVFYGEMHALRSYANKADTGSMSILDKVEYIAFYEDEITDTHVPGEGGVLDKVEWRLGENSRMSVGYMRMYDKGRDAGINPLLNSLYILPRSWILNKPIPGSIDGTKLGVGMRLMHNEMRGTKWNMSGFFTGLHSYWEFGISGVFFISIIAGVYSAIVLRVVGNFTYLGLPLIIALYDTWWQMPKLWLSEISVQLFTVLIPTMILWYVITNFYKAFFFFIRRCARINHYSHIDKK